MLCSCRAYSLLMNASWVGNATGCRIPAKLLILRFAFLDAGTGLENQFTGEEMFVVMRKLPVLLITFALTRTNHLNSLNLPLSDNEG